MSKLRPLWRYKQDDKKTWKYIDCNIHGSGKHSITMIEWIRNPDFAYEHLSPYINERIIDPIGECRNEKISNEPIHEQTGKQETSFRE